MCPAPAAVPGQVGRAAGSLVVGQQVEQAQQYDGEQRVERVERAALQPLGDGGARVAEAQLLQDVVHAVRLDRLARPRQQSAES